MREKQSHKTMSDPLSDDTWASQERPVVSPHTSLVSTPASESRSKEEEIGGKIPMSGLEPKPDTKKEKSFNFG